MKIKLVLAAFLVLVLFAGYAVAAETHLQDTIAAIDNEGGSFDGEISVKAGLEKIFNIGEPVITGLKKQGLGYGDMTTLLAVAEKMPGGIIDVNIDDIISTHDKARDKSWSYMIGHFKLKYDDVVVRVDQAEGAIREIEQARNIKPSTNNCGKPCYAPWGNAHESSVPAAGGAGGAGAGETGGGASPGY